VGLSVRSYRLNRLAFWLSSLVVVGLWAESGRAATLDYWRFNARLSRLEIVTDQDVKPKIKLIANPTRLVVDLPGVKLGQPSARKRIGSYVKEARVGQVSPWTVRLVVELGDRYTLPAERVWVRGLAPNRWVVQLPKLQALDLQMEPQPPEIAIAVPAAKSYPKARVVIAVDPGHGGADVGAVGRGGLLEKTVVLDISQRLSQYLETQGVQAVMTRDEDRELDLAPRVAISERARTRAFVSIHANSLSLGHPEVNGLETYYYSSGFNLARMIHRHILQRVNISDRGVKRARFYVLRNTSMPAVLVETGFVTGRQDAANFASASFRARMAQGIGEGIVQYFR
jgi:N-acetylmuramoyl-L-alanine amidase